MANNISKPFQITEEDIERSSTLDSTDIDSWAILINDTYQCFDNDEKAAWQAYNMLSALN